MRPEEKEEEEEEREEEEGEHVWSPPSAQSRPSTSTRRGIGGLGEKPQKRRNGHSLSWSGRDACFSLPDLEESYKIICTRTAEHGGWRRGRRRRRRGRKRKRKGRKRKVNMLGLYLHSLS